MTPTRRGRRAESKTPTADYDAGCRVRSTLTKCPTKTSRTSSSPPISRRENASVSRRHSRRSSKSLAKTSKFSFHKPVAPRSRIHAALFKSKSRLEAENAALRQQLTVLQRKVRGRVRFTSNEIGARVVVARETLGDDSGCVFGQRARLPSRSCWGDAITVRSNPQRTSATKSAICGNCMWRFQDLTGQLGGCLLRLIHMMCVAMDVLAQCV